MSVRTQPGHTELTLIRVSFNSSPLVGVAAGQNDPQTQASQLPAGLEAYASVGAGNDGNAGLVGNGVVPR